MKPYAELVEMTDERLIEEFYATRNPDVFTLLYDRYAQQLRGYIAYRARTKKNNGNIDDVIQRLFYNLFRRMTHSKRRFAPDCFRAYFFGSASKELGNTERIARRQLRNAAMFSELDERLGKTRPGMYFDPPAPRRPSERELKRREEKKEIVDAAMVFVTPAQEEILRCVYWGSEMFTQAGIDYGYDRSRREAGNCVHGNLRLAFRRLSRIPELMALAGVPIPPGLMVPSVPRKRLRTPGDPWSTVHWDVILKCDGLNSHEAAGKLGITVGALKGRRKTIRKRLRENPELAEVIERRRREYQAKV